MRSASLGRALLLFSAAFSLCAVSAFAQSSAETGKLKVKVSPKQAYVFVDGKAIRDGKQTIQLTAGSHKVAVYNYGYQPKTEDVEISGGKTSDLSVDLQASGDKVSGPFAAIEFKGDPRAAVLLNGESPSYFVGHVDEFDWNWIWHQRLLVHPGTYQVAVTQEGNTVWSGQVNAEAGKRVVVYLNQNGKTKIRDFKEGANMPPQPRFRAGIASATVAVSPVSAQLSAERTSLQCGDTSNLKWTSADAADVSISNLGDVQPEGEKSVSPTKNTNYVITAKGPGGTATQSVGVSVNATPTANISVSQPEVHFHKIGDKVVQQDSATVNWTSSNANAAKVDPLGKDATSGSETIMAAPKQDTDGPINETNTYTVTATNACGGSVTQTASLHVVGSIDPPPALALTSTFYPTAYPTHKHPNDGLLASEAKSLDELADHFKDYQQYDHKGTLLIVAHADVRGSNEFNQKLSERRAKLVKDYLVAKGVPADKINIKAVGKTVQLDKAKVATLQSQNSEQPKEWMTKNKKATWLAYNRRADIVLEPRGTESARTYPIGETNARVLWQQAIPPLQTVQKAEQGSAEALSASTEREQ